MLVFYLVGSRKKRSLSANDTSDTYSIAIGTSSCRVWDSDLNQWVNSGELVSIQLVHQSHSEDSTIGMVCIWKIFT